MVWSKTGQRNFYNVDVEQNLEPYRELLKRRSRTKTSTSSPRGTRLSLTGRVSSKEVADRAAALAAPFGKTIVNNLQIPAAPVEKQILLRVKFAELDRSASNQFAVNLISTGATNTIGRITSGGAPAPSPSSITGGAGQAGQRQLHHFRCAEYLRLPPGSQSGRIHEGAATAQPASNPGGAEPGNQQRQRSQLPGGRRVSDPGSAGRRQFGRGDHSIPRVRYPTDVQSRR